MRKIRGRTVAAMLRTGVWAVLTAALAGTQGPVEAHDAKWGSGGVLHDYSLRFCARRDTPDVTSSNIDDYYKVRFEYRWRDVGYEDNPGRLHMYWNVPWLPWGPDADIHVASTYTSQWRCRPMRTIAVLAGHGKSNGLGDYINGRVVTESGNTHEIDIDWWVQNQAASICVWGVFTGQTCIFGICWGGRWTTSIRSNCV